MGACTSASAEGGNQSGRGDAYQTKEAPTAASAPVTGSAAAYAVPASPENKTRGVAPESKASSEEAKASMEHPTAIHSDMVFDLVCTSTPNETISCGADKTIVKYDWKGKAMNGKWTQHSKSVDKLCYGERTKFLFSGSRDTTVRMWNLNNKAEVASFRGHTLPVAGLAINSDNTILCSGGRDYSVRFWDVERREQIKMKTEPRNVVTCMSWIPGGEECVLQGSEDRELRVWDARTQGVVQRLAFEGHFSLSCDVSPDGLYFLTAHNGFAGGSGPAVDSDAAGGGGGGAAAASSAAAADGCMVKIWDRRKGCLLQDFIGHTEAVYDCVFLPGSAAGTGIGGGGAGGGGGGSGSNSSTNTKLRIASCSKDASIKIWEQDNPVCLSTTTLRKNAACEIRCLAVSPHHTHTPPTVLYSGSGDGFINVWNVKANGKLDCIAQSKRPAAGI